MFAIESFYRLSNLDAEVVGILLQSPLRIYIYTIYVREAVWRSKRHKQLILNISANTLVHLTAEYHRCIVATIRVHRGQSVVGSDIATIEDADSPIATLGVIWHKERHIVAEKGLTLDICQTRPLAVADNHIIAHIEATVYNRCTGR